MTTSAEVASHAGLSRSTVSQILNGRDHLFTPETIARVRTSAAALGYRPSLAGRTLARGTSDIVITLIPDVTFNPRLRELVDVVSAGLAQAGLTNLLQFVGAQTLLEDTILGLKPFGVVSLAPLSEEQRRRLLAQGVHLIVQSTSVQAAIDRAIGRLQAEHLIEAGYDILGVAVPVAARERKFALPREEGVTRFAASRGVTIIPTLHVALERGGSENALRSLPPERIGIAAYNDEVAMAVIGAGSRFGRSVPIDLGVIGVDNSSIAQSMTPTITTVDYDIVFSGHAIVEALLRGSEDAGSDAESVHQVEERLRVVQGESTSLSQRASDEN
ncbi:LacI family DNA-binding transcriptional regulator [Rathayibacter sp. VKM Ac-2760]|uniref:LacI family DNA-binding transcriptional regulator n=1 Tax=Rathayibacter sp. VKM Ac-2760 TaxID=2609253 RepID=UPI001317505C|nr:LacI family DNA-binding transcriptional regulator [Rathayibacter sp. VKM Ac-2760]QHC57829.1 substrate-binding domain-containing protein [Rathayibacter sp. VKM Ac-2760]